jgi:phosphate starvation-inducible protein PhoH
LNAIPESSIDFGSGDNARLASLCGPLDANLRQLEDRLGVEIRRRSGQFSLSGVNAAVAASVLRALHDRAAAQPVSPEDVHLAIQEAAMGGVPSEDEQGVETVRGRIRGRGPAQQEYLQNIRSHDLTLLRHIGPAADVCGRAAWPGAKRSSSVSGRGTPTTRAGACMIRSSRASPSGCSAAARGRRRSSASRPS